MHRIAKALLGVLAFAGPAAASDVESELVHARNFSGYVDAYLGGLRVEAHPWEPDISDKLLGGVIGRINIPVMTNWNLQLDGSVDWLQDGATYSALGNRETYDITNWGGAAHLYWRDPDRYALGVFGAISRYNTKDIAYFDEATETYPSKTYNNDFVSGGLEGQLYLGAFTLYAQGYIGERTRRFFDWPSDEIAYEYQYWGARGVVRYYPVDRLRLEGEVGYTEEDITPSSEYDFQTNTLRLAAQATYRFDDSPVSVFGRYQYENPHQEGGDIFGAPPQDSHRLLIGARFSFGSDSLLNEERYGATMDTVQRNSVLRR